jgi:hypothetical protein
MNWDVWREIEELLSRFDVRPILAVVPNNEDPSLMVSPPRDDFWDRVRSWQSRGWAIGLHGWQHRYQSQDSGIVGLNNRSEFAGLSKEEQTRKISAGVDTFTRERVRLDCWIAPGHSFDWQTVEILRSRNISIVSDGYFWRPVRWGGVTWVPQQLWRFRLMPAGIWTVCFHHNGFSDNRIDRLRRDLERFSDAITDLRSVVEKPPSHCTFVDRAFAGAWRFAAKVKRVVNQSL